LCFTSTDTVQSDQISFILPKKYQSLVFFSTFISQLNGFTGREMYKALRPFLEVTQKSSSCVLWRKKSKSDYFDS